MGLTKNGHVRIHKVNLSIKMDKLDYSRMKSYSSMGWFENHRYKKLVNERKYKQMMTKRHLNSTKKG